MSTIKHAVIAAAGLGSRLGMGCPKCLIKINEIPLIAYLLKLLEDVEDVRIVVGYQEQDVMECVLRYRKDITFVRNQNYRTTSTLTSYFMGAEGISERCMFMDADIIFQPDSFIGFKQFCVENDRQDIIGVTAAKTRDAVYVSLDNEKVSSFSRENITEFEWANLCYISSSLLKKQGDSVFQQLSQFLPLMSYQVKSYEIDTKCDLLTATESQVAEDVYYCM